MNCFVRSIPANTLERKINARHPVSLREFLDKVNEISEGS